MREHAQRWQDMNLLVWSYGVYVKVLLAAGKLAEAEQAVEEAATFPPIGVTAWNALTGGRALQAGDTVPTLGSGGVSLFALQFAKLFGTRVIAITSSKEKVERLKALGTDAVVNSQTTPDWHMAVRELTQGRGVDRVIEVGGPGTLEQSIKSTRIGGVVSIPCHLLQQVFAGAYQHGPSFSMAHQKQGSSPGLHRL